MREFHENNALENFWPGLPTVDGTFLSSSLLIRCTPATSLTGKVHLLVVRPVVSEVTKSLSGARIASSSVSWML